MNRKILGCDDEMPQNKEPVYRKNCCVGFKKVGVRRINFGQFGFIMMTQNIMEICVFKYMKQLSTQSERLRLEFYFWCKNNEKRVGKV